ncbi:MAG: hypothetical protein LBO66_08520 [Deltaproteobacteria bacterium]|jgi:hypothetical protein|nr:hypothetical protein [Deltaproteobacteria bacterium]
MRYFPNFASGERFIIIKTSGWINGKLYDFTKNLSLVEPPDKPYKATIYDRNRQSDNIRASGGAGDKIFEPTNMGVNDNFELA